MTLPATSRAIASEGGPTKHHAHGRDGERQSITVPDADAPTAYQAFTSIAWRSPSESRLKQIEVTKMHTPGSTATQGCT